MTKRDESTVSISKSDASLTRELVQFAVEQLTATLHLAGTRPIAKALERYRDAAADLLERLR